MSSPRLAEFSAVKICCDLLSSPRLSKNLVNKNIGTILSPRLAELVKIYCDLMSSPRLAGFSAVNDGGGAF